MTAGLDLHPRVVTPAATSRSRGVVIDPGRFDHPVLAAELADALVGMRAAFGIGDGTAYHHRQMILDVLRALPASLPRTASLSHPGGAVADALHRWEAGLAARYDGASDVPARYGGRLRRLLRYRIAQGTATGGPVAAWAHGERLHPPGRSRPLDEFSNAERIAIRDVCRQRLREMERRLRTGGRLIADAHDPGDAPTAGVAAMLWSIRHGGPPAQESLVRRTGEAVAAGMLDRVPDCVVLPCGGDVSPVAVANALLGYVHPSRLDLLAARCLLQLATGAAPDELTGLRLDDVDWAQDAVRIRLHKSRAHRTRTVRVKASPDGHGWKGGDVLHRMIAATGPAREAAEASGHPDRTHVFLTARLTGTDRAVSVRAVVLRSVEMAAGDDHTAAVYRQHYAQTTTLHVLAGAAVNAAQQQVFDRVSAGPRLVNTDAATALSDPDTVIAAAARAATDAGPADRELSVAECSDPFDSPFDEQGLLCRHRPAMCFACSNAIVFTDHLPRLLAYRQMLHGYRDEMPPPQFAAVHGRQLENLERIIGSFTDDQRAAAAAQLHRVHVPLSQRGTHR